MVGMAGGKILVTRSSMPPFQEYCDEIAPLWESHWLTNCGVKHEQLARELERYLSVAHVELFVNGHSALECAFDALGLGTDGRDEVITTPFTFASTTNAIIRRGLTPVFCDVKPDDFTMDPEKIEALVTERTCAIVPVHVYGNLCDVDAIGEIARRRGLAVVYDAAHAFGVRRGSEGATSFGDASMLSFHATKVFNTIEGGAVCFGDATLAPKLAAWRNFGLTGAGDAAHAGGNAKMNEFCAAMGLCNLRHVDGEIAKRGRVVERYREQLDGVAGLRLPGGQPGVTPNYAYLPVIVDPEAFGATRDDVFSALAAHDVGARKYFSPLTSAFSCHGGRFDVHETPIALRAAARVITLPLYADLAREDVDRICDVVREVGSN